MRDTTIIILVFLICLLLFLILTGFIAWLLFFYQKKQNTFEAKLEENKNTYEKELLKTQLEMQEEVFGHISQEIHDNIGQYISLAKLQLNNLEGPVRDLAGGKIDHTAELLTKALDDLRDLSKSLSSEMVRNAGLEMAVDLLISQLKRTENFEINFKCSGDHVFLDEKKEIIIFRIIQESVSNIIRHAGARSIWIDLNYETGLLHVLVRDDGRGFDISTVTSENKNLGGIQSMRKRAKLLEAILKIESNSAKGTSMSLTVPILKTDQLGR
jgi:two-component system, NarL family, sensor kinase